MSRVFAVDETIDRPADEVWAALTDWRNAPKWMNGIESMSADGETVAGTKLTFRARGADRASLIAQCEPGRLLTLRSTQGSVTADYTYELQEIGRDRTRISMVAECRSARLLWRILFPMLRLAIRRVDGKQLENLRRYLEA